MWVGLAGPADLTRNAGPFGDAQTRAESDQPVRNPVAPFGFGPLVGGLAGEGAPCGPPCRIRPQFYRGRRYGTGTGAPGDPLKAVCGFPESVVFSDRQWSLLKGKGGTPA